MPVNTLMMALLASKSLLVQARGVHPLSQ